MGDGWFSGFSSDSDNRTFVTSYDGSFNTELTRLITFGDLGGVNFNVGAPNADATPQGGALASLRDLWPLDATTTLALGALAFLAWLFTRGRGS